MSLPCLARALGAALAVAPAVLASSHREAPFVTEHPKVDGTDLYVFNSYEPGRDDFVTLVANYLPLQDAYGGPNYFFLDPDARYEIHVDNDGDAKADVTFTFSFEQDLADFVLDVGEPGNTRSLTVPLINVAPIAAGDEAGLLFRESYRVQVTVNGKTTKLENALEGGKLFRKPADNIGLKSIPDYAAYAAQFIYPIDLPGGHQGRLFVGQRKEPFVVNLGEAFDLVNTNPLGPPDAEVDELADKNITSWILEVPKEFLRGPADDVIAVWTTASLPKNRQLAKKPSLEEPAKENGPFIQVSRLGNPLVNELVIGLDRKDLFNASPPQKDAERFLDFVTHPTFPELLEILFGVTAPNLFPRQDLVQVFLTGVPGLNEKAGGTAYEAMRLNMAIAATPAASQNNLGVLGGDMAGYPNGRRPGDDVVDITLRAAMGVLLDPSVAPSGSLPYTDGATVDASFFDAAFPYLKTPLPGSPSN